MFGNAYTPVVDSCQCMTKPIQYCKVKYCKNKNLKKNKDSEKQNKQTDIKLPKTVKKILTWKLFQLDS